jgi:hypothetical protein
MHTRARTHPREVLGRAAARQQSCALGAIERGALGEQRGLESGAVHARRIRRACVGQREEYIDAALDVRAVDHEAVALDAHLGEHGGDEMRVDRRAQDPLEEELHTRVPDLGYARLLCVHAVLRRGGA